MNIISTACMRVNRKCYKLSVLFLTYTCHLQDAELSHKRKSQCNKNCKHWVSYCRCAPCCRLKTSTKFSREASSLSLLLHVRNGYVCSQHLWMPRAMGWWASRTARKFLKPFSSVLPVQPHSEWHSSNVSLVLRNGLIPGRGEFVTNHQLDWESLVEF